MQNGYAQHGGHNTPGAMGGSVSTPSEATEQAASAGPGGTNVQPDINLRAVGDSLFIPDPVFLTGTETQAGSTGVEASIPGRPGQSAQFNQFGQIGSMGVAPNNVDGLGAPNNLPGVDGLNNSGVAAETFPGANLAANTVVSSAANTAVNMTPNTVANTVASSAPSTTPDMPPTNTALGMAPGLAPAPDDDAGNADAKSLRKLENSALQQITVAKEQSGGDPNRYASAIARARREQIETAKGVKA